MALDYQQIFKKCFDSTKNALRITGVAGSLDGQITWNTGLGAITHILGPSDQGLSISAQGTNTLSIELDESGILTASATGGYQLSGAPETWDLDAIAGGADVDLTISIDGLAAQTITFSAADPLIGNFAAVTAAEAADVVNDQAVGFNGQDIGGTLLVIHDNIGQSRTLEVTGGTANATFAFPAGVGYGTGNVYLTGQLAFSSGLGPMVSHIAGPDDEDFYISSATGQDLVLRADGDAFFTFPAATHIAEWARPFTWDDSLGALIHIGGPTDEDLSIAAAANNDLLLQTSGTGHINVNNTAGGIEIDDNGLIEVTGRIKFHDGLTAVSQIRGPTDEALFIASDEDPLTHDTYYLYLGVNNEALLTLVGNQASLSSGGGPFNLTAVGDPLTLTVSIDGGAAETITFTATDPIIIANGGYGALTNDGLAAVINDQAVDFCSDSPALTRIYPRHAALSSTIEVTGGTARATLGYALATDRGLSTITLDGWLTWPAGLGARTGGHILGPSDQDFYINGETNRAITLTTSGTGHAVVSSAGGTITVNDDAAGITVTAVANGAATLSTSGTGHATVGTANNTLTVYDDAATGIGTNGHLHVGGLLTSDAARVIETIVMQAGSTAHVITVAATDHFIGVDCSAAAKQVNLEAAATAGTGRVLIIKDQSGNAGANPITIDADGGEHIDEADTYVINSNYGSVTLICTGTATNEWAVV